MNKKIVSVSAALVIAASSFIPAFAQTSAGSVRNNASAVAATATTTKRVTGRKILKVMPLKANPSIHATVKKVKKTTKASATPSKR